MAQKRLAFEALERAHLSVWRSVLLPDVGDTELVMAYELGEIPAQLEVVP